MQKVISCTKTIYQRFFCTIPLTHPASAGWVKGGGGERLQRHRLTYFPISIFRNSKSDEYIPCMVYKHFKNF